MIDLLPQQYGYDLAGGTGAAEVALSPTLSPSEPCPAGMVYSGGFCVGGGSVQLPAQNTLTNQPPKAPPASCGNCQGSVALYCGPFGFTVCRSAAIKVGLVGLALAAVVIGLGGLVRR